jgi:hypothetical protein
MLAAGGVGGRGKGESAVGIMVTVNHNAWNYGKKAMCLQQAMGQLSALAPLSRPAAPHTPHPRLTTVASSRAVPASNRATSSFSFLQVYCLVQ